MLTYLSDVLANIHYVCCFLGTLFLVYGFLQHGLNRFTEYKKHIKNYVIAGIIFTILAIITPTSLKYDIVSKYIEENTKLKIENIQMRTVVARYNLEKELEELRNGN